ICGGVGSSTRQSDCDAAEAAVLQAQGAVHLAESRYAEQQTGPRPEAVAVAQAAVTAAERQIKTAQAAAASAQAQVKLVEIGARPEQVAGAEAQVKQAEAALERAQAALQDTRLVAPFNGLVAQVNARVGETVGVNLSQAGAGSATAPVMTIGDVTDLRVET